MKNQIKVIMVIIGTMIGAGFASGTELYLFFGQYGYYGILGVLLSCILTSLLIFRVFIIVHNNYITSYSDFLSFLLGKKHSNSFFFYFIYAIIQIFLLISFFIMVAGFGAYFSQELNLVPMIGYLIIVLLSLFVFNHSISGIIKTNTILIPSLIMFIFFLGFKNIFHFQDGAFFPYISTFSLNWILDAILYSSYNSILLVPILITLNNYIKDKKEVFKISVISFFVFFALSITILSLLLHADLPISQIEIPMLYVTEKMGKSFNIIYGIIILVAIFTSAISAGYSFLQNFKTKKTYQIMSFLICLVSLAVSSVGFSSLVTLLYPIFGYLGIVQILLILLKKTDKTDINKERKRLIFRRVE